MSFFTHKKFVVVDSLRSTCFVASYSMKFNRVDCLIRFNNLSHKRLSVRASVIRKMFLIFESQIDDKQDEIGQSFELFILRMGTRLQRIQQFGNYFMNEVFSILVGKVYHLYSHQKYLGSCFAIRLSMRYLKNKLIINNFISIDRKNNSNYLSKVSTGNKNLRRALGSDASVSRACCVQLSQFFVTSESSSMDSMMKFRVLLGSNTVWAISGSWNNEGIGRRIECRRYLR